MHVSRPFLLAVCAAAALFGQGRSDEVRNLNNHILQLHGALQRADATQAAQIRAQAATAFAQRATALGALMREDPGEALKLAFSQELRNELSSRFPGSGPGIEEQGTWRGASDHLIFDDPDRQVRRFQVTIRNGADTVQIYSANGEPHCVSGNILTATGIRLNNVVAAGSTSVSSSGSVAAAGCTTLGAQNTAVLLVDFPGIPLPSNVTAAGVTDIFFGGSGRSVNTYWQEASYGQASATGQVFGPFTLDRVYSCDEYSLMRSAAIAAADASVFFPNYTRVFIVFPNPGSCGWAGLGTLGCGTLSSADGNFQASTSWLLASYMGSVDNGVKLATHEGGHNLSLHHASSRDFGTEALGPVGAAGTLSEYGDPFSTMGSWNFGHYGVPHKVRLGWLGGSRVLTTETTGSHTVFPAENNTAGLQALKIRRGTGNSAWLWVELRQPIGTYDSTLSSQVFSGGLVHYEDSTTGTRTHLLDFTTATSSFADPALTGTWVDPYTNVSLTLGTATSSGLPVSVNYGALPCNRVAPGLVLSPPNPSAQSGTSANYTVSVTNNDTAGCPASTFSPASSLPTGWTTPFSPVTVTANPGQTVSATMTKAVPAGFTPGTYGVNATASDANHAAVTGTANITVVAPPEPISVTLTASPTTVPVRGNVTITARVANAAGLVAGASVTFRVTRPGGQVSTSTAVTNSSGVATWVYRAQQRGSYSATASASAGGANATSAPVTFTAN